MLLLDVGFLSMNDLSLPPCIKAKSLFVKSSMIDVWQRSECASKFHAMSQHIYDLLLEKWMNTFQVTAPFQYPLATSEKRILAKNALNFYAAWKVFIFGVVLVRIFPNSAWIRRNKEYPFVFSANEEKCRPE